MNLYKILKKLPTGLGLLAGSAAVDNLKNIY